MRTLLGAAFAGIAVEMLQEWHYTWATVFLVLALNCFSHQHPRKS